MEGGEQIHSFHAPTCDGKKRQEVKYSLSIRISVHLPFESSKIFKGIEKGSDSVLKRNQARSKFSRFLDRRIVACRRNLSRKKHLSRPPF